MTIHDLVSGSEYEVLALIEDFHGGVFRKGQRLRFVERHFLPYDDGHTLIFSEVRASPADAGREIRMYLQGTDQREIIEQTDRYLREVTSRA